MHSGNVRLTHLPDVTQLTVSNVSWVVSDSPILPRIIGIQTGNNSVTRLFCPLSLAEKIVHSLQLWVILKCQRKPFQHWMDVFYCITILHVVLGSVFLTCTNKWLDAWCRVTAFHPLRFVRHTKTLKQAQAVCNNVTVFQQLPWIFSFIHALFAMMPGFLFSKKAMRSKLNRCFMDK